MLMGLVAGLTIALEPDRLAGAGEYDSQAFAVTQQQIGLRLMYVCGNRFRIRTTRRDTVRVRWDVARTADTGSVMVPGVKAPATRRDVEFETTVRGTTRIFLGAQVVETMANRGEACESELVFPTTTAMPVDTPYVFIDSSFDASVVVYRRLVQVTFQRTVTDAQIRAFLRRHQAELVAGNADTKYFIVRFPDPGPDPRAYGARLRALATEPIIAWVLSASNRGLQVQTHAPSPGEGSDRPRSERLTSPGAKTWAHEAGMTVLSTEGVSEGACLTCRTFVPALFRDNAIDADDVWLRQRSTPSQYGLVRHPRAFMVRRPVVRRSAEGLRHHHERARRDPAVRASLRPTQSASDAPALSVVQQQTGLRLTYLCGNRFRIRTTRRDTVRVRWDVARTADTGSVMVPGVEAPATQRDVEFETTARGTTRIFLGAQVVDAKANGGSVCTSWPLVPDHHVLAPDESLFVVIDSSSMPPRGFFRRYAHVVFRSGTSAVDIAHLLTRYGATIAQGTPSRLSFTLLLPDIGASLCDWRARLDALRREASIEFVFPLETGLPPMSTSSVATLRRSGGTWSGRVWTTGPSHATRRPTRWIARSPVRR